MADSLTIPRQQSKEFADDDVKIQTYWDAVRSKLWRDKITILAILLGAFMVVITLTAPLIGDHLLGFDSVGYPYDSLERNQAKRNRNAPPTWFEQGWETFQGFSNTCLGSDGCQWSMLPTVVPAMVSSSTDGISECLAAELGECNWLGTDQAGRDVLTRAIYGGRISLRIGAYVAIISITLGVSAGLISGYYAATPIDDIINAVIMTLGSIPLLFLLIILAGTFSGFRSPEGLAFLLGIFGWMGISRLIRGQIFSIREREYILASRSVGTSTWRIMFRHMLPNVASIIIVVAIFDIAGAIIAEAGLSYLGVGISPPTPSWGNMMQGSLGNFTDAPWLVLTPGIFIFLTTLAIYLVGDGLRDALDPWVKHD
jgi:peptide/nickel transport system permease protein